jgi:hypothetical protein
LQSVSLAHPASGAGGVGGGVGGAGAAGLKTVQLYATPTTVTPWPPPNMPDGHRLGSSSSRTWVAPTRRPWTRASCRALSTSTASLLSPPKNGSAVPHRTETQALGVRVGRRRRDLR